MVPIKLLILRPSLVWLVTWGLMLTGCNSDKGGATQSTTSATLTPANESKPLSSSESSSESENLANETSAITEEDEQDLKLASDVLESVLDPKIIKNSLGPGDVNFDVTQGPVIETSDNKKILLLFTYPRDKKLLYAKVPFQVTEIDLEQKSFEHYQLFPSLEELPDPALAVSMLGLITRQALNHLKNKIRLITSNPIHVVDYSLEEKKGRYLFKVADVGSVVDHFHNSETGSFCLLHKNTSFNIYVHYPEQAVQVFPWTKPTAPLKHVCDKEFLYVTTKNADGIVESYKLDIVSKELTALGEELAYTSQDFYLRAGLLYLRRGILNLSTSKTTYSYFKIEHGLLTAVKSIPGLPVSNTYEVKLYRDAATPENPQLPIIYRVSRPKATAWETLAVTLPTRPVPMSKIDRINEKEIFLSTTRSLSYLDLETITKGKGIQNWGNPFIKSGGQVPLSVVKHQTDSDFYYYISGNTNYIVRFDPKKPWTVSTPAGLLLPTTDDAIINQHNPNMSWDVKKYGATQIKKILISENSILAGGTITAKKSGLVLRHDLSDINFEGVQQSATLLYDFSDLFINENQLWLSSYSDKAGEMVKVQAFNTDNLTEETLVTTNIVETSVVKFLGLNPVDEILGIYSSQKLGSIDLTDASFLGSINNGLSVLKIIPLPNGHFLAIIGGKVTIIKKSEEKQFHEPGALNIETLLDLTSEGISPLDFSLIDNSMVISDRYGEIIKLDLPKSKILLK